MPPPTCQTRQGGRPKGDAARSATNGLASSTSDCPAGLERGDRYDYTSNSVKLRYIHRFDLFSRIAKLELAWRYEDRSYSSITPSIGEDRQDDRHRWRMDFEIPVVGSSALQIYYGYADYSSNYPSADYTQNLVGTRFLYRW